MRLAASSSSRMASQARPSLPSRSFSDTIDEQHAEEQDHVVLGLEVGRGDVSGFPTENRFQEAHADRVERADARRAVGDVRSRRSRRRCGRSPEGSHRSRASRGRGSRSSAAGSGHRSPDRRQRPRSRRRSSRTRTRCGCRAPRSCGAARRPSRTRMLFDEPEVRHQPSGDVCTEQEEGDITEVE